MAGKQDAALVVPLEFTTAGSVVKAVGELLASRQVRVPSGGVLVLKIDEKPSGFDDSKKFISTWHIRSDGVAADGSVSCLCLTAALELVCGIFGRLESRPSGQSSL